MERNVKIIIGVIISIVGIVIIGSDYYLSLKHEVFDDMNKAYYEQNVVISDEPEEINNGNYGEINDDEDTIIDNQGQPVIEPDNKNNHNQNVENYIAYISIPKIELNRGIYNTTSTLNNVNKNIYVHPASTFPNNVSGNNLILASHSGSSSISYFKKLYKLELEDDVYLEYNGKTYHYKIKNIYTVLKDGTVALRVKQNVSTISLITCLFEEPNVYNILASLALAHELGLTYDEMIKGVSNIKPIEHRLQIRKYQNYTIIDDAYNSNPVGSKMAVDVLNLMPGKKIIVTPGMIELKDKEYEENYEFGKHISEVADYTILIGKKQTKPIYDGLISNKYDTKKIFVLSDIKEAFPLIEKLRDNKTYVLLENDLPDLFNEK